MADWRTVTFVLFILLTTMCALTVQGAASDLSGGANEGEGSTVSTEETNATKANTTATAARTNDEIPDPSIQSVDISVDNDEITIGESVTVEITAENLGGAAGHHSTISASFPTLDQTGDLRQISEVDQDLNGYFTSEQGDEIWNADDEKIIADYALVEASTGESLWYPGVKHSLEFTVTPEETGTFIIFVRTTMTDDDDATVKYTDPDFDNNDDVDQQEYPVRRIEIEVQEERETLNVIPNTAHGDPLDEGAVVAERLRDGETNTVILDDDELVTFGNSFINPGSYRVHLYGSDDGFDEYWGWKETRADAGQETTIGISRGMVYSVDHEVRDRVGDNDELEFEPSSIMPVSMSVRRPRHGEEIRIQTYVYETASERSSVPTDTYDFGYLGSDSKTVDFSSRLPNEEGEYRVDFKIQTYVREYDSWMTTDLVLGPSIEIHDFRPPAIDNAIPDSTTINIGNQDTRQFSVSASDPDTPQEQLSYTWFVDGRKVVEGPQFVFDAEQYGQGRHDVNVVVADRMDRTSDATRSWSVDIRFPPEIQARSPSGDGVTVSTKNEARFEVSPTDPDSSNYDLTVTWWLDGRRVGNGEQFRLQSDQTELGHHTLRAVVRDNSPVTRNASAEWELTVAAPPEISGQTPAVTDIVVGASASKRFAVQVTDPDTAQLTRIWYVDGSQVTTADTFKFQPSDYSSDRHTIRVEVSDGTDATADPSRSWDVVVRHPPTISSASPPSNEVTISVKSASTFEVSPTDPDSSSYDLITTWQLDGEVIGDGERLRLPPNQVTTGQHTLRTVVRDNSPVTDNATREWQVTVAAPPTITSRNPTTGEVTVGETRTKRFSVRANDPDTPRLTRTWYVDGNQVTRAETFVFRPSDYSGDRHTVRVEVSDRTDTTTDRSRSWEVAVRRPPVIDEATPGQTDVITSSATPTRFEVSGVDPDTAESQVITTWYLDGNRIGTGSALTFSSNQLSIGKHVLKAIISDRTQATKNATRQWTLTVAAPPSIVSRTPEGNDISLGVRDQREFSVEVRDRDTSATDLEYTWTLDGQTVAHGHRFSFNASQYGTNEHRVAVTISDRTDTTNDTVATWGVSIIESPSIDSVSPGDSVLHPGQQVQFDVTASDPNGYALTRYRWKIDGQAFRSESPTYTFKKNGSKTISVNVTNERGVWATETFELNVERVEPEITSLEPAIHTVVAGKTVSFDVRASDPANRDISFEYTWHVDGRHISNSRTPTYTFDEVGEHEVRVTVQNQFGTVTTRTISFTVRNDQPFVDPVNHQDAHIRKPSKEPIAFGVKVQNNDTSVTSVQIKVNGTNVSSRTVRSNSKTISYRRAFSHPGNHTVTFTATDGHGAQTTLQWDVQITSRPPEFRKSKPSNTDLDILTGQQLNFSVKASDPEDQGVSYRWYRNGAYVGNGANYTAMFERHGAYDIRVRAVDPQGITCNWTWSVNATSFTAPISTEIADVSTQERIESLSTPVTLALSANNPEVNSRTAKVEFRMEIPDGVNIHQLTNVQESSRSAVIAVGSIDPNYQTSMSIRLVVNDDSLRGQTIKVPYQIRYYPKGHPQDYHTGPNRTLTFEIAPIQTPTKTIVRQTSTNNETQTKTKTTSGPVPGFGFLVTLIGVLCAGLYLAKSRKEN